VRENRTNSSEGGEGNPFPTPILMAIYGIKTVISKEPFPVNAYALDRWQSGPLSRQFATSVCDLHP
jgi:hypothetical protein